MPSIRRRDLHALNIQENRSVRVTFRRARITLLSLRSTDKWFDFSSGTFVRAAGESQLFTATPNARYTVDKWILDGSAVQSGGTTYKIEQSRQIIT
jgi:hypothetical protein